MERLASIGDLPSKFKRKPMTAEEMELINARFGELQSAGAAEAATGASAVQAGTTGELGIGS